jgi:hypothetical protein
MCPLKNSSSSRTSTINGNSLKFASSLGEISRIRPRKSSAGVIEPSARRIGPTSLRRRRAKSGASSRKTLRNGITVIPIALVLFYAMSSSQDSNGPWSQFHGHKLPVRPGIPAQRIHPGRSAPWIANKRKIFISLIDLVELFHR